MEDKNSNEKEKGLENWIQSNVITKLDKIQEDIIKKYNPQ